MARPDYERDAAEYLKALAVELETRTMQSVRPDHPTRVGSSDHPIAAQVTIRRGASTAPGTEGPVLGGRIVLVDKDSTTIQQFGPDYAPIGKLQPLTRRTGRVLGIQSPRPGGRT